MILTEKYQRLDLMDNADLAQLLRRVHAVDASLFNVTSLLFQDWQSDFRMPGAWRTVLWTLEEATGGIVGYNAINIFRFQFAGREQLVVRFTVGTLCEFRGHARSLWAGVRVLLPLRLGHPRADMHFVDLVIHPSAYYLLDCLPWQLFPRRDTPSLPPQVAQLLRASAATLRIPPAALDGPVRLPVSARIDGAERAYWADHPHRGPQYFVERNPGYASGEALLVCVPFAFSNVYRTVAMSAARHLRQAARSWIGRSPVATSVSAVTSHGAPRLSVTREEV